MSQESFSSLNLSHADKYIKTSAKARNIMNCFSNSRQEMNTWDVLTGRQGDSDSADSIGLGWTCGHMWPRNTVENKSRIRQATLRLHKPVARAGAAFSRHLSSWRVCSWRLRKNLGKQNLAWLQDSTKGLPQCAHLHSLTTPLWSLVIPCVVWILSLSLLFISFATAWTSSLWSAKPRSIMCDETFDEVGSLMNLPRYRIGMEVATWNEQLAKLYQIAKACG